MIKPAYLTRKQISELAERFANATSFTPGETEIIPYVKEKLSGKICYTDNKADSSGGSIEVNREKNIFTIYLSQATSEKRDVFTIAHELGHYVLHSHMGEISITAKREQTQEHSSEIDTAEREANSFAASFLMPSEAVRKKHKEFHGNIAELADFFKVSYSAMLWRCRNLGLCNE